VVDAVVLLVPEGVSIVIPPDVPLLCHAGPRPVDPQAPIGINDNLANGAMYLRATGLRLQVYDG
jgi:hypothetical protein